MQQIKENMLSATLQALSLIIIRLFTIPVSIWRGSLSRLAEQWKEPSADETTTEFPIFGWLKGAWDGVIFLTWPIGVVAFVLILLSGIFSSYVSFGSAFASAFGALIVAYFAPITVSLLKESLIIFLSMAQNLEKLVPAKETEHKD